MLELLQNHVHDDNENDDFLKIMNTLDLNQDGKLDYNEFLQSAINHQSLLNKDNINELFNLFDTNNDGMISMQELKEVFSTHSVDIGWKRWR